MIKNTITAIASVCILAFASFGAFANIMTTAPMHGLESVMGGSPDGRAGFVPSQGEVAVCSVASIEDYKEQMDANGLAYIVMPLDAFLADPDVQAYFLQYGGVNPAEYAGYMIGFIDPAIQPEGDITTYAFGSDGCYTGEVAVPAAVVIAGLDGK